MLPTILHIGYPKTSTTWFQERFYPHVKNANYLDRQLVQDLFLKPGAFEWSENDCKIQVHLISKNDNRRLIICEELLLGRLRPGGVKHFLTKEIANRLHSIFPGAEIVLFIRNQIDALASSYLQYIQSGGNYSISKFLYPETISGGDYNSLVLLGPDYFCYHQVIDYYTELFGKENVHIYLYEEFRDANSKFISEYSKKFGFLIDEQMISFKRKNEGYSKTMALTRRFFNAFTRNGPLNKYYLLHLPYEGEWIKFVYDQISKTKFAGVRQSSEKILGNRNLSKLSAFYCKSNQILIDKYGLNSIKNYNYPL